MAKRTSAADKKLTIAFIIIGSALIGLIIYFSDFKKYDPAKVNDQPGTVQGDNPQNIPESKLPVCNFNGSKFEEIPCYSPPGATYL